MPEQTSYDVNQTPTVLEVFKRAKKRQLTGREAQCFGSSMGPLSMPLPVNIQAWF